MIDSVFPACFFDNLSCLSFFDCVADLNSVVGVVTSVLCRLTVGSTFSASYEQDLFVDMGGYIPLDKRVYSACHCFKCSSDAWICSCYKRSDFLVQFSLDGERA